MPVGEMVTAGQIFTIAEIHDDLNIVSDSPVEHQNIGGITENVLEEEKEVVTLSLLPGFRRNNPFPDQTPFGVLQRLQWLATFEFAVNTHVEPTYYVPDDMFSSQMLDVLRTFRFFRCKGIRYVLQWSSNPFLYGWFATSCYPRPLLGRDLANPAHAGGPYPDVFMSFVDTMLHDISQQTQTEHFSPWNSPVEWLDLHGQSSLDSFVDMHGIWFGAPSSLDGGCRAVSSDAQGPIVVQLLAQFVEPETIFPCDPFPFSLTRVESPGFRTQSKMFGFTSRGMNTEGLSHPSSYGITQEQLNKHAGIPPTEKPPETQQPEEGDELKLNYYGSMVYSKAKFPIGSSGSVGLNRRNTLQQYLQTPTLVTAGLMTTNNSLSFTLNIYDVTYYSRIIYMSQFFEQWHGDRMYELILFGSKFHSGRVNVKLNADANGTTTRRQYSTLIADVTVSGTTRLKFRIPYVQDQDWMPTQFHREHEDVIHMPYVTVQWLQPVLQVADVAMPMPYLLYESAAENFDFRSKVAPSANWTASPFETQMLVSSLCQGDDWAISPHAIPHDSVLYSTFEELASEWSWRSPNWQVSDPQSPLNPFLNQPNQSLIQNLNLARPLADQDYVSSNGIYDYMSCFFAYASGSTKFKVFLGESDEPDNRFVGLRMSSSTNILSVAPPLWSANTFVRRPEDGYAMIDRALTQTLETTAAFISTVRYLPLRSDYVQTVSVDGWYGPGVKEIIFSDIEPQFRQPIIFASGAVTPVWSEIFVAAGDDFSLYYPIPPPTLLTSSSYVKETFPNWPSKSEWTAGDQEFVPDIEECHLVCKMHSYERETVRRIKKKHSHMDKVARSTYVTGGKQLDLEVQDPEVDVSRQLKYLRVVEHGDHMSDTISFENV